MAIEKKEYFRILKDENGDGVAVTKLTNTETWDDADNCVPTFIARDAGGAARVLHARDENSTAPTQQIMPVFVAKKKSDNTLQYVNLDDDGNMLVSSEGAKTPYNAWATFTPSGLDSGEGALDLTIDLGKFDELEIFPSSFKDYVVDVSYVDDALGTPVKTKLFDFRVKGGSNDQPIKISCLNLDTSGGTGTQIITFDVYQQQGSLSPISIMACAMKN